MEEKSSFIKKVFYVYEVTYLDEDWDYLTKFRSSEFFKLKPHAGKVFEKVLAKLDKSPLGKLDREPRVVFFLPNPLSYSYGFDYGFVFKMANNGISIIISPEKLSHLEQAGDDVVMRKEEITIEFNNKPNARDKVYFEVFEELVDSGGTVFFDRHKELFNHKKIKALLGETDEFKTGSVRSMLSDLANVKNVDINDKYLFKIYKFSKAIAHEILNKNYPTLLKRAISGDDIVFEDDIKYFSGCSFKESLDSLCKLEDIGYVTPGYYLGRKENQN